MLHRRPDPSPAVATADQLEAERLRRRIRRLSHWLDSEFRIPGTRFRVGADPLLGLIPGVGDFAGLALSAYSIHAARKLGIPRRVLVRMIANTGVDFLLGTIPLIGDLFDFAFRANRRNLKLVQAHLDARDAAVPGSGSRP